MTHAPSNSRPLPKHWRAACALIAACSLLASGAQAAGRNRKHAPRQGPTAEVRRTVAGPGRPDPAASTGEPSETVALRRAEADWFGTALSSADRDTATNALDLRDEATVSASGLPPLPMDLADPRATDPPRSAAFVSLTMPGFPVRLSERVVRYLEFFRRDPRGRQAVAAWYRASGRYEPLVRAVLREHGVPEDLMWVAVVESKFDAAVRSPAGAAGLWQFMPHTARAYGLVMDRWVDERLDPVRASHAAALMLHDLHARFGSWELALAGYNMGYGGLMAAIRKLNTNDFAVLSRYESAIPWETTLYVPRIVSLAIAAQNPAYFGLDDVEREPAEPLREVRVAPGTGLSTVAASAGVSTKTLRRWNPQYLSQRTPPYAAPGGGGWPVRIDEEPKAARTGAGHSREPPTHVVRHGQTIEEIAEHHRVLRSDLARLNALRPNEVLRAGTVLMLPSGARGPAPSAPKTVVVLPRELPAPEGFERVFYRVVDGDDVADVAAALSVSPDDLRRWNALDVGARVHSGMVLAALVPATHAPTVPTLSEDQVTELLLGSEALEHHLGDRRGRVRGLVVVGPGDDWERVAERLGMSVFFLARINRRSHREPLRPGEILTAYLPRNQAWTSDAAPTAVASRRRPAGAPHPEDLPALPTGVGTVP